MNKLNFIHHFRAAAIIFIVAGHSIDIFEWQNLHNLERLFRIFISNGSALFVFIAGYLFQHLSIKFSTKKYYTNKITNVIIPYLIISIPALVIFIFFIERPGMPPEFYTYDKWYQLYHFLINGSHLAPLWFIPMITIFFIIAPLMVRLDKTKYFYYFLPLMITVSCVVIRDNPFQNFIHFFSLYVLGMFFSKFKSKLNDFISLKKSIATSFLLAITFALIEYYFTDKTMTYFNFIQKLFFSIFFLGLLIRFNNMINSKTVNKIADYSFGIFFIHSYVISFLKLAHEKINDKPLNFSIYFYLLAVLFTIYVCL